MTAVRSPLALFPRELFCVEWTAQAGELAQLCEAERALMQRAVPKRRAEFAAGRACAHRALARLHLRPAPILRDRHGSPQWPAGARGSISHTRGCVLSVAALDRRVAALGVDVDSHADAFPEQALPQICRAEELQRLLALPARSRRLESYALFSIKEAIYKAVYGAHGLRLGFLDATVQFDLSCGLFAARVSRGAFTRELVGRVGCDERHVFSGVWWLRDVALEAPQPLIAAPDRNRAGASHNRRVHSAPLPLPSHSDRTSLACAL